MGRTRCGSQTRSASHMPRGFMPNTSSTVPAEFPNLADLVRVGQRGQDRLVIRAGEHFKLFALGQRPDALEQRLLLRDQVIEQAAGEVNPTFDVGMLFHQGDKRLVGDFDAVLVDEIELADRLVIMQNQAKDKFSRSW